MITIGPHILRRALEIVVAAMVAAQSLCAGGEPFAGRVLESVEWGISAPRGRPLAFPLAAPPQAVSSTNRVLLSSRLEPGRSYVVEIDYTASAGVGLQIELDATTDSDDAPLAAVVVTTSPYHEGETLETARIVFVAPDQTSRVAGNEPREVWARWHAATDSLKRLTPHLGERNAETTKISVSVVSLAERVAATVRRVRLCEVAPNERSLAQTPETLSSRRAQIAYLSDFASIAEGDTESILAQMRASDYDAAIVSVERAGRSLYPSRYWAAATSGDAFAPLAQLLQRERIAFIPMLDLATPLAPLEDAIARTPEQAASILWTNGSGEVLRSRLAATNPTMARLPHYNILSPQVQEAILGAVYELAMATVRGGHQSGVAILLSGHGYAVLPDESWGCDAATLAAFAHDTGIVLDETLTLSHRAEIVLTQHREAWTKWRCDRVRGLYHRMAAMVASLTPVGTARLFLIGDEMFTAPSVEASLAPSLPRRGSISAAMRRVGFDLRETWDARIVLPRTVHTMPLAPLAASAIHREIESDLNSDSFFATTTSSLIVHETRATTSDGLTAPVVTTGTAATARDARHLAVSDVTDFIRGGATLSPHLDPHTLAFVREFRRLPRVAFTSLDPSPPQPLVVRTAKVGAMTWAYFVNASSVPITTEVALGVPAGQTLTDEVVRSGGVSRLATAGAAATHSWQLELAPYALRVFALGERVTVTDATVERRRDTQAEVALRDRVTTMNLLVRAAKRGVRCDVLTNADFEQPLTTPALASWQAFGDETFTASLDRQHTASGSQSLVLHATSTETTMSSTMARGVVSDPFTLPATGRLFLLAQIGVPADSIKSPRTVERAGEPNGNSGGGAAMKATSLPLPLRFVVFGTAHRATSSQSRSQSVGDAARAPFYRVVPAATAQGDETIRDGVCWRRVVLPIDQLPLSGSDDARLAIELTDAGTVWVDELVTYSVAFTSGELTELMRRSALASQRLDEGKLTSLEVALDGFWFTYLATHVALDATSSVVLPSPLRSPLPSTVSPLSATGATTPTFWSRLRSMTPF